MAPSRLEFKKFAAFIKVDGQELECHALSVDKEKKHVSCWIASEVGKVGSLHQGFFVKKKKYKTNKFVWLICCWPLPELHLPCRETTQRYLRILSLHGWKRNPSICPRG